MAAALARLHDFVPRAGGAYRDGRNHDHGPDRPQAVSGLSPYLQRRLVSESQLLGAVLQHHQAPAVQMFAQEVLWRTYWQGWLARHPAVWRAYVQASTQPCAPATEAAIAAAEAGQSGLRCADIWADELRHTGLLHNHARMWFASAWIFTLKLPWARGAAFFYRHLLDADPASNTLSWRWVAGLHTKGKHYLAEASNIGRFAADRNIDARGLVAAAQPLPDDGVAQSSQQPSWPAALGPSPELSGPVGLVIFAEDLSVEQTWLGQQPLAAAALVSCDWVAPSTKPAAARQAFSQGADDDAAARAQAHWSVPVARLPAPAQPSPAALAEQLARWASAHQLQHIVALAPRVGPWGDLWAPTADHAALRPFGGICWRWRPWDRQLMPRAERGFFHFKKHVLWPTLRQPPNDALPA